jgi:CRP/FNR family transcriptional regulator
VALQATTTCALRYGEFERLCAQIPPLQHWLLSRLGGQLKAYETLSSWTARKELTTRVLSFFLDLQQRLAVRQKPLAGYYRMPMRKCDIALFLNITPETFSRTLGVLRSNRLLDIRGQTFRLTDVTRGRRFGAAVMREH